MPPHPDGSDAPFSISSAITLDTLYSTTTEKMEQFPSLVCLQYHLDSDKTKQASASIQTMEELTLFKACLQFLIIPGCQLVHQRIQLSILRMLPLEVVVSVPLLTKVSIYFILHPSVPHKSHYFFQGAKTSGTTSNTAKQKSTSAASGELDGANCHQELIKELQEQWKCNKHSKNGTETKKWCYTSSLNDGGCQLLTISNLSFWDINIVHIFQ